VLRGLSTALALFASIATAHAQPAGRTPSPRAARLIEAGQAYLASGDRGSAIAYFRDAIAADPRAAAAYEGLGECYRGRGSYDDARRAYEAGLARMPDSAPLWLGLARTFEAQGALDEAARALRSLLARDPDHLEALSLRAELARRRGAWSEALTAYRALLSHASALPAERVTEARRYEAALRLLARPLDPVSAPRACAGTPLRRALARCR